MGAIVWLASYPKSGNTWMRAFLHNLLRDPPAPIPINQLTQFTIGDTLKGWYAEAAGKSVDGMSGEEVARLRPVVHRMFTRAFPDSVFVKTHMMLGEAFGVPLISMEVTAGAIYIVRDPRDVAISAASHFGTDIDGAITLMNDPQAGAAEDALHVPQYYGTWSHHVTSWTAERHGALHVVRYEDMLQKPMQTFTKVAQFLGFRPPPDRVRRAIEFSSFKELKRQEQTGGFQERSNNAAAFFRVGAAGQWRQQLTPGQINRIVTAHGPVMRQFGYKF